MRKIVLSMMVVGALLTTSCKGEKKEDEKKVTTEVKKEVEEVKKEVEVAVDSLKKDAKEIKEGVESALEGVTIPKFEDEKVTEHLKAYAVHAKEYIEAKGDVVKNSELAKKSVEFAKKSKQMLSTLDEEAAAKFKSAMTAIQSKMAPGK